MNLKREKSCGCIIVNDNKVLLILQKNNNFWGFPKGHMEKGENELQTALREVKEEVGLDVKIDQEKRYSLNYTIRNEIDKTSVFYVATPTGGKLQKQESEVEDIKWCSFQDALNRLSFNDLKEMLNRAINDISNSSTL